MLASYVTTDAKRRMFLEWLAAPNDITNAVVRERLGIGERPAAKLLKLFRRVADWDDPEVALHHIDGHPIKRGARL